MKVESYITQIKEIPFNIVAFKDILDTRDDYIYIEPNKDFIRLLNKWGISEQEFNDNKVDIIEAVNIHNEYIIKEALNDILLDALWSLTASDINASKDQIINYIINYFNKND